MALSPNLRGSLLMAVAMAGFSMNDASTKFLTAQMNFGQIMFLRGVFACTLVGLLAWHARAICPWRTMLRAPVALRIIGEVGGTTTFLAAIAHLPLANLSAIFQSLPLVITMVVAVLFGEPVGWRRWLAIIAGFVGVLIVVRPGIEGFNQFTLLALLSVAFCAVRDLATKYIAPDVPTLYVTLVTTVAVMLTGGALVMPLGGWTPPSPQAVGLLAMAAVLVLIGYQCVILALRIGDISAVAPFRYLQLLWAILFGAIVFGHIPDLPMVVGAAVIVASGVYAFHRERVRDRLQASNTAPLPPDGV